jgi:hypothetical protein
MNEIGNMEKLILSNIDLEKGPDNIQINLAIKLNIFKLFSLNVRKFNRLIKNMHLHILLLTEKFQFGYKIIQNRA